jgi:hypothetical protein
MMLMAAQHGLRTLAFVLTLSSVLTAAQTPAVPVPRPFPGAGPTTTTSPRAPEPQSPSSQPPASVTPAAPSAPAMPSTPLLPTTVPLYPSAEFLDAFDAGTGQRYYLYGTNQPYADIVAYYRTTLKTGGHEIYKAPGMYQFDLGKYQEDTMAYPPSVVIRDYVSENSPGYLFVTGTSEKRFRTVIQIVPPGPGK